jgi:hypothetical protein
MVLTTHNVLLSVFSVVPEIATPPLRLYVTVIFVTLCHCDFSIPQFFLRLYLQA